MKHAIHKTLGPCTIQDYINLDNTDRRERVLKECSVVFVKLDIVPLGYNEIIQVDIEALEIIG